MDTAPSASEKGAVPIGLLAATIVSVIVIISLVLFISVRNPHLLAQLRLAPASPLPTPLQSTPPTSVNEVSTPPTNEVTTPQPPNNTTGKVSGTLIFPSESFPNDMQICAENLSTKQTICTDQIMLEPPMSRHTYTLEISEGQYHVYAIAPSFQPDYKAYYNQFVVCGLEFGCNDHTPIVVEVRAGETLGNINPQDWYNFP